MPGGVIHQLSRRAIAELKRCVPQLPPDVFEEVIRTFPITRKHIAQSSREIGNDLKRISAAAENLYHLLAKSSDELKDYLGLEYAAFGDPLLPERLQPHLLRLAGLSANAEIEASKHVKDGRNLAPTTLLVLRLRDALMATGQEDDAQGDALLAKAFDIACEELKLSVADSGDTVRKAISRRGGQN